MGSSDGNDFTLVSLRSLQPENVADILGRDLKLTESGAAGEPYALVGGIPTPFGRAELRWGGDPPGGILVLSLIDTLHPTREEIEASCRSWLGSSILPADPRDPEARVFYVYRVPVGELRMGFHDSDEGFAFDWSKTTADGEANG